MLTRPPPMPPAPSVPSLAEISSPLDEAVTRTFCHFPWLLQHQLYRNRKNSACPGRWRSSHPWGRWKAAMWWHLGTRLWRAWQCQLYPLIPRSFFQPQPLHRSRSFSHLSSLCTPRAPPARAAPLSPLVSGTQPQGWQQRDGDREGEPRGAPGTAAPSPGPLAPRDRQGPGVSPGRNPPPPRHLLLCFSGNIAALLKHKKTHHKPNKLHKLKESLFFPFKTLRIFPAMFSVQMR